MDVRSVLARAPPLAALLLLSVTPPRRPLVVSVKEPKATPVRFIKLSMAPPAPVAVLVPNDVSAMRTLTEPVRLVTVLNRPAPLPALLLLKASAPRVREAV